MALLVCRRRPRDVRCLHPHPCPLPPSTSAPLAPSRRLLSSPPRPRVSPPPQVRAQGEGAAFLTYARTLPRYVLKWQALPPPPLDETGSDDESFVPHRTILAQNDETPREIAEREGIDLQRFIAINIGLEQGKGLSPSSSCRSLTPTSSVFCSSSFCCCFV